MNRPTFYDDFICKAGSCTDSCCIGWEIDIDAFSLENYMSIQGDFGDKLRANIKTEDDYSYFILKENDRCPFLDKSNLCEIYSLLGEDGLCDICYNHPRFFNMVGDIEECGVGLCCERACEMLFDDTYNLDFFIEDTCEEIEKRNEVIRKVLNDDNTVFCDYFDFILSSNGFYKILDTALSSEAINDLWVSTITSLIKNKTEIFKRLSASFLCDKSYKKLLAYNIFRSSFSELISGDENVRNIFSLLLTVFVYALELNESICGNTVSTNDRINFVKLISKQFEYSNENINILTDFIKNVML